MGFAASPERAIRFTKLSVALTCSWPPSLQATRKQSLIFNALWCTAIVSSIGLLLPLLNAIYEYRAEPIIVGKTVSLFSAVAQVTIKMIVCRLQQTRFQALLTEMENFCKHATADEKSTLQRHVDRYKYYHLVYTLWCFLTTVFVISGPLYLPQTFPTHAKYPFPVERQPLKSFLFLHQSVVGFQVSAGMAIDAEVAFLLRYTTARFEILAEQLCKADDEQDINACIRSHSQLLRYMKEIYRAVNSLVLTTVATTTVAVIFGSLNLVTKQPLPLKVLYILVVFSASVELFMYAWPADNLLHSSTSTAMKAYNTNWFEKNAKIQRKVFWIILRSQKIEGIHMDGVMPNLSLSYYAQYLYKAFSYFTALRLMMVGEDDSSDFTGKRT